MLQNKTLTTFYGLYFAALTCTTPVYALEDGDPQDGMWLMSKCANPGLAYAVKKQRLEGYVTVMFDIAPEGNVENIRIEESVPEGVMDDYVTRALNRWQYFGYVKNAEIAGRENVKLTFTFSDEDSRSCTHTKLPPPPSSVGDPKDPHQNLQSCMTLEMPKKAARKKRQGLVEFSFDITAEGAVENISPLSGNQNSEFSDRAENALKRWQYHPFLAAGKPVKREGVQVQFHFGDLPEGASSNRCSYAPWHATQKTMPVNQ